MLKLRTITLLALGMSVTTLVAGCATVQDAKATRDSLTEVTEDPSIPSAAEQYDATLSPEPIVDPVVCSDYLVVTVRGTGEPTEGQMLSPVARMIAQARPGATQGGDEPTETPEVSGEPDEVVDADTIAGAQILDLDYPADTNVKEGSTEGVRMLIDTLKVQSQACPDQTFVLLGYSQGALIVGDALAAPDARMVGATTGEIPQAAADRIRAIVLYGDPRFVGDKTYNVGSFSPLVNGVLPRPVDSLNAYTDRLRDYCANKDFICQSSLDLNETGHVAYFENGMQQDGAAYAISLLDTPLEKH